MNGKFGPKPRPHSDPHLVLSQRTAHTPSIHQAGIWLWLLLSWCTDEISFDCMQNIAKVQCHIFLCKQAPLCASLWLKPLPHECCYVPCTDRCWQIGGFRSELELYFNLLTILFIFFILVFFLTLMDLNATDKPVIFTLLNIWCSHTLVTFGILGLIY